MIQRILYKNIKKQCFQGKVITLIGPRQVGKTTLLKQIQKDLDVKSTWLNADESDILLALENAGTSTELLQLIGNNTELVLIDEAQQVKNIGLKIKLLHDTFPQIQIIVTGSSAFDLQNKTNEPLTGRKKSFNLYPISFEELVGNLGHIEAKRLLETRIQYGSYPDVVNALGNEKEVLLELANSYLYKDILQIEGIRKPDQIEKLIRALAFQLGNEVSYNELAQLIGLDAGTVEKYLDLLEKTYIIYKLPAYSRNMRNEIKKGKKYYFYDNGIRNAVLNNFAPLELRMDKGALWENFLMSERIKYNSYHQYHVNSFFWRTKDQAEIDYLEEKNGVLHAFEFKWKPKKSKLPKSFQKNYPEHTFQEVNQKNYTDFITP